MDQVKLSYFQSRYSQLDADGLAELMQRRDSLAEEACAALDHALAQRGVSPGMLRRYSADTPAEAPAVSKRNWKLIAVQLVGALLALFAASALAHIVPRWLSLLSLLVFLCWWVFGTLRQKRRGSDENA